MVMVAKGSSAAPGGVSCVLLLGDRRTHPLAYTTQWASAPNPREPGNKGDVAAFALKYQVLGPSDPWRAPWGARDLKSLLKKVSFEPPMGLSPLAPKLPRPWRATKTKRLLHSTAFNQENGDSTLIGQ